MQVTFKGKTVPFVSQDKMTPGEIDAVERVTDLTLQRIRRLGETCVCGHGLDPHRHKDDAGKFTDDTSCASCECDQHVPDLPTRISTAFLWIALRRDDPSVKFADVSNVPQDELIFINDEPVDANPTDPPPQAESPTDSPVTP